MASKLRAFIACALGFPGLILWVWSVGAFMIQMLLSITAFISESIQYRQFAIGAQVGFMWACFWHMLLSALIGLMLVGAALTIWQGAGNKK